MNCQDFEDRLDDFVDGTLETDEARQVERHLQACPGCRAEADDLRSLLREAGSLPRRIEPGRDLWPGIAGDLRHPLAGRFWPGLAAALLILAAAAVTATFRQTPPGTEAPSDVAAAGRPDDAADLSEAEEAFRSATAKLMAALERRKTQLSPRVIAELEETLRVVDQAIAETDSALARDPGNPYLGRMLTDTYATKINLLSKAVRIPGAV